jgi:hypothetical protein
VLVARTIVEEKQHAAASCTHLLRKHAVVKVAAPGYNERVVGRHAL